MPTVQFTDVYPDGPATVAAGGGSGGGSATNDLYPGMPVGATPIERDVTIAAAGTTAVWTPSAVSKKIVLASAFVSTDTAMRVAIVDALDVQGQRPVDGYFGANGGASPNLVPVPYVVKAAGNVLYVVTAGAGNVKVRVQGWEQ